MTARRIILTPAGERRSVPAHVEAPPRARQPITMADWLARHHRQAAHPAPAEPHIWYCIRRRLRP